MSENNKMIAKKLLETVGENQMLLSIMMIIILPKLQY